MATVTVGTGTKGTRFVNKKYPVTEGLIAGTTKLTGKQTNLVPEQGSLVPRRQKEGIDY